MGITRGVVMLEKLIPAFEVEMEWLSEIATKGYTLGFKWRMNEPPLLRNAYVQRWQDRYDARAYLFKDPTVVWFNDNMGNLRWSDNPYADTYGVMADAKRYGLVYGGIFSIHVDEYRNWLTVARDDRELTDAEMAALAAKFQAWANSVFSNLVKLTEPEKSILRLQSKGLDRAAVAAELGVSVSTVKQRQTSVLQKLKVANMKEAISVATALSLIS